MPFDFNVFGAITGALGLLGFLQVMLACLRLNLPSKRLEILEAVLSDIETLVHSALEDGVMNGISSEPIICEATLSKWGSAVGLPCLKC